MSADDHGSISTYTNHKCRCELCREAIRLYMRGWYGRNREHWNTYMRDWTARKRAAAK